MQVVLRVLFLLSPNTIVLERLVYYLLLPSHQWAT